jgi:hypothetical protein
VLCVPGDMAYRGKPRATGWWQRLFGRAPPPR